MVLKPQVPVLAAAAVPPAFEDLIRTIPSFQASEKPPVAADFDWALHPGGSTIITGVQNAMNITEEHLRASYEIYMNYGNSSSATIMAVMNQLRNIPEGKDNVVACAFGPGISLEMMVLRRRRAHANGLSEVNGLPHVNGLAEANGHVEVNGLSHVNGHGHTNLDAETSGNTHINGRDETNKINDLPTEDVD